MDKLTVEGEELMLEEDYAEYDEQPEESGTILTTTAAQKEQTPPQQTTQPHFQFTKPQGGFPPLNSFGAISSFNNKRPMDAQDQQTFNSQQPRYEKPVPPHHQQQFRQQPNNNNNNNNGQQQQRQQFNHPQQTAPNGINTKAELVPVNSEEDEKSNANIRVNTDKLSINKRRKVEDTRNYSQESPIVQQLVKNNNKLVGIIESLTYMTKFGYAGVKKLEEMGVYSEKIYINRAKIDNIQPIMVDLTNED